jgi:polyphenol oxidase
MLLTVAPDQLSGPLLRLPFPAPAWLTLASAGDMSRDERAQSKALSMLGIADRPVVRLRQIHSCEVILVDDFWRDLPAGVSFAGEGDGLCSAADGPWLAISVADCLPLYCYDRGTGAYGLLHSGWRGTGILERAVEQFAACFGTDPADLVVLAGPGIHSCAYEVDEARGKLFSRWGPESVQVDESGAVRLDLYAANRWIADRAGIGSFTETTHCTAGEPAFGSYRREGPNRYTSMLALIGPQGEADRSRE